MIKFALWVLSVAGSVWGGSVAGLSSGNLLLGAGISALGAAIVTVLYMMTFKVTVTPRPGKVIPLPVSQHRRAA